ncbi:MAG TPA: hypothetical protein VNI81_14510 [Candidatus Limnocylindrales bacterium]|jgi:hypothetical protein|nr:hypothetical protein [Candidatus Limnocylindrales bacterium]
MRIEFIRRTSFSALAGLLALGVAIGISAYAGDKKAAPGSVFVSDKGKFNILLDGASIGREEFEIEPSGATWTAKGSTSMKTPDGKSAKVTGTLTLQPDGAPVSYDWSAQTDKANSAHIMFVNGVAKTTLQMQGAAPYNQDNSFGSPLIAVLDNNLYHQFELLAHIYNWNKKGAQDFPVLIPQQLTPGTISVEFTGTASAGGKSYEGLKATTSDIEIQLYLDSSHKLMRLEVPSAKVAVVRE